MRIQIILLLGLPLAACKSDDGGGTTLIGDCRSEGSACSAGFRCIQCQSGLWTCAGDDDPQGARVCGDQGGDGGRGGMVFGGGGGDGSGGGGGDPGVAGGGAPGGGPGAAGGGAPGGGPGAGGGGAGGDFLRAWLGEDEVCPLGFDAPTATTGGRDIRIIGECIGAGVLATLEVDRLGGAATCTAAVAGDGYCQARIRTGEERCYYDPDYDEEVCDDVLESIELVEGTARLEGRPGRLRIVGECGCENGFTQEDANAARRTPTGPRVRVRFDLPLDEDEDGGGGGGGGFGGF